MQTRFTPTVLLPLVLSIVSPLVPNRGFASDAIRFDLPSTAAAEVLPTETTMDQSQVRVTLRLSSLITSPNTPQVDQWLVTCRPRNRDVSIVDYSPRTETASELATPIQVKQSAEKSKSMGLSVDGAYGHFSRGNVGADNGSKNSHSVQFDRLAPVQAVTAAGTIDRGRGVYFKWRSTTQQVLEGEKRFEIVMRVPAGWRGTLLDVSVRADRSEKHFGFESETVTVAAADFVVAAYRHDDPFAQSLASELAEAEHTLRVAATYPAGRPTMNPSASQRESSTMSIPAMIRHVAAKLDFDSPRPDRRWLGRLLAGRADPHLDKEISLLPMPTRIAVLDYADLRTEFERMEPANHIASSVEVHLADPIPVNERDQVLVAQPTLTN